MTDTFTSVPLSPCDERGIEGAELEDDEEEEELGIDADDELEEELDDDGLGNEGVDGILLDDELLGIDGDDGMLLEELLGIDGDELDDEELGIEGIELLLELLELWLDWHADNSRPNAEAVASARNVAVNVVANGAGPVAGVTGVLMFLITSSSQCACIRRLRVSGLAKRLFQAEGAGLAIV